MTIFSLQHVICTAHTEQDVDQSSGEDLNPNQTKRLRAGGEVGTVGEVRNPDRPSASSFVPEAPDLEQVSYHS